MERIYRRKGRTVVEGSERKDCRGKDAYVYEADERSTTYRISRYGRNGDPASTYKHQMSENVSAQVLK